MNLTNALLSADEFSRQCLNLRDRDTEIVIQSVPISKDWTTFLRISNCFVGSTFDSEREISSVAAILTRSAKEAAAILRMIWVRCI
jgi:hypothetical protein